MDIREECCGLDEGKSEYCVIRRWEIPFKAAEQCERMTVSYHENSVTFITEFFMVGKGLAAVSLNMKCLTPAHEDLLPCYERILSSLNAEWL